jgi:hypothetical protein
MGNNICKTCNGFGYILNKDGFLKNRTKCNDCDHGWPNGDQLSLDEFLVMDAELIIELKDLLHTLTDAVICNGVEFEEEDGIDFDFYTRIDKALVEAREYEE